MKTFTAYNQEDVLTADLILEGVKDTSAKVLPEGCPMCGDQLRETLKNQIATSKGIISHVHCSTCDYRNVETFISF